MSSADFIHRYVYPEDAPFVGQRVTFSMKWKTLHEELNQNRHPGKKEFPLRVFAAAFVISLLATIFSGWQSWRMHYLFEEMTARHIALTKSVGRIMLLDETLTMSARMAASTGDLNYEKKYDQFDPELTKEINEVRNVLPQLEIKQFVTETDEANTSLVKTERRAFALTHQGKLQKAMAILTSNEYMRLKRVYANGMEKTVKAANNLIEGDMRNFRMMSLGLAPVSVVGVLVLLSTWLIVIRSTRSWLAERREAEDALREAYDGLEDQVEQRTVELLGTNEQLRHEISERKHAEEILRYSEQRFRDVSDAAGEYIWEIDVNMVYTYVSNRSVDVKGYTPEELVGHTPMEFMPVEDIEPVGEIVNRSIANKAPFKLQHRDITRSGEVLWEEVNGVPFYDENGLMVGLRGTGLNITGRKQAEEKIRKLNDELEIKVRVRTQQLLEAQEELVRKEKLAMLGQVAGSVGHELRNPLGVMNNAVYFLQTVLSDADETTREYLNIIKDEIASSDRIVSDLLDSVRTRPPHPETVGIAQLIEQILGKCTIPPSVTIKLDISTTLPPLRVDSMQIHQVFRNLISNGVEAMPEGGTLEIRAVEKEAGNYVTISVRDTGIGMTPEQQARLFQPLFTTKARGIGLGLVVVKNLTEANGGSIEVQSEAGKGTLFSVTLPTIDKKEDEHA